MKAILVVEIPSACDECPCYCGCYCPLLRRELGIWASHAGKPVGCPLKTMPQKKTPYGSDLFNDYVNGWNDCIDAITGETE